jgi:hypothetical protein
MTAIDDRVKRCFKCGDFKSLGQFYAHPEMSDGTLGKCKECTKLDVRLNRQTNPRARAYDTARAQMPHRVALRRRIVARWNEQHPKWDKAKAAANNAVRDGKIVRQTICEGCGLKNRLEKHHPDYDRPLLVLWLCKPCHAIADKIRRRMESF